MKTKPFSILHALSQNRINVILDGQTPMTKKVGQVFMRAYVLDAIMLQQEDLNVVMGLLVVTVYVMLLKPGKM